MKSSSNYALVSLAYWAFMLTDGALRMLILLYFHQQGYSALNLAMMFLIYEIFGVITNLTSGWLSTHVGLKPTLITGLALQIIALLMLSSMDSSWTGLAAVAFIMGSQSLAGIAKDFTKMSAKSALKTLVPDDKQGALFWWTALLTGTKNAIKGGGFFLGGYILDTIGYQVGLWALAALLGFSLIISLLLLPNNLGNLKKSKLRLKQTLSQSPAINRLSLARFFLFASRDVWFVIAVPVFLAAELEWGFTAVGGFLSAWIIAYGLIQSLAPALLSLWLRKRQPCMNDARILAASLIIVLAPLFFSMHWGNADVLVLMIGLGVFGVLFALNSAVHSYLILAFAPKDSVGASVGFYYMANAGGRLIGTLLSGLCYTYGGLSASLCAAIFLTVAAALASRETNQTESKSHSISGHSA